MANDINTSNAKAAIAATTLGDLIDRAAVFDPDAIARCSKGEALEAICDLLRWQYDLFCDLDEFEQAGAIQAALRALPDPITV